MAVIGGGPAGLMAAQTLIEQGLEVDLFDAMPSVGRKFLLAGRGGLNLTHDEAWPAFITRYGPAQSRVRAWLERFGPLDVRAWAQQLGQETFVGTSGKIFPVSMKASPLLRAWLRRLLDAGVRFHLRHRWVGWPDQADAQTLHFATPNGPVCMQARAVVLALGGASWPHLGSDAAWVAMLAQQGVAITPLAPANCGFEVPWSSHFKTRYGGHPLKSVAMTLHGVRQVGECVVTQVGLEGSLVYAFSRTLRQGIEYEGAVTVSFDLLPHRCVGWVRAELTRPRGARSLSTHLKARLGLHGVKAGLLHECVPKAIMSTPDLAHFIKHLPVTLRQPRPLARAISTAGGVHLDELSEGLMLKQWPGVYCIGEMLDWEASTGGYLLNACLASGRVAGEAVAKRLL